jgi:hypothetical protein
MSSRQLALVLMLDLELKIALGHALHALHDTCVGALSSSMPIFRISAFSGHCRGLLCVGALS